MNYEKMTLKDLRKNLKREFPITLTSEQHKMVLSSMNDKVGGSLDKFNKTLHIYGCSNEGSSGSGNIGLYCEDCKTISLVINNPSKRVCGSCGKKVAMTYNNSIRATFVHIYHADKGIYSIHSVLGDFLVKDNNIYCDNMEITEAFAVWYMDERGLFYNSKGLNQINTEKSITNGFRGFRSGDINLMVNYEDVEDDKIKHINSLLDITNYPNINVNNFIDNIKVAASNIVKMDLIKKEEAKKVRKLTLLEKLKGYMRSSDELFDMTNLDDSNLICQIHTKIGSEIGYNIYCPKCRIVNDITLTAKETSFSLPCCNTKHSAHILGDKLEFQKYAVEDIIIDDNNYYRLNNIVRTRIDENGELDISTKLNSIEKLERLENVHEKTNSNKVFKNSYLYQERSPVSLDKTLITKSGLLNILDFFKIKDPKTIYNLVYKQFEKTASQGEYVVLDKSGVFNHRLNKTLAYQPNIVEAIGLNRLLLLSHKQLMTLIENPYSKTADIETITGLSEEVFEGIYEKELNQVICTITNMNRIKEITLDDLQILQDNRDILMLVEDNYNVELHFFNIIKTLNRVGEYNLQRIFNRIRYYSEEESMDNDTSYHSVYYYYAEYLENLVFNIRCGYLEKDFSSDIYYPQSLKLNIQKQKNIRTINTHEGLEGEYYGATIHSYEHKDYKIRSIMNMKHAIDLEEDFSKPFSFLLLDYTYENIMYVTKNDELIAILVASDMVRVNPDTIRIIPNSTLTKKDRKVINNFIESI